MRCADGTRRILISLVWLLAGSTATGLEPATNHGTCSADPGTSILRDAPVVWYEEDQTDIPEPAERDPHLYFDQYEASIVHPAARLLHPVRWVRRVGTLFGGDHVVAPPNVNALGEVPNSTWFTNRIGLFPMSLEEIARGSGTGEGPDRSGKWTVVSAKTEGVTPGFNIRDARGNTYLIKFDPPGYVGMTTTAGVISARILHAAGYNVPDDATVTFRREDLALGDDVRIRLPDGTRRPMTDADIDAILEKVDRLPDGRWFAISSRFLSGTPVGPFDYRGRRGDDPNDRIDHEDRRELRGLEIFASWISHFDTKQHNSLDMYVTEDGRSFIRHYLIDFASTLGTAANGPSPRYAHEYTVDPLAVGGRLLTLGFHESDWRTLERPDDLDEVGYFVAQPYDPTGFEPLQPNTAFANRTGPDGYWAAKIISAFTDAHLEAICRGAGYQDPEAARYMARTLAARRDQIARHFFDQIAPLEFFTVSDRTIAFHDLGAERGVYPGTAARYRYRCAAVDSDRGAHQWTDWRGSDRTEIPLDAGAAREACGGAPEAEFGFLAVETQVDRGSGWSGSVTAYVARASERIVAVDR